MYGKKVESILERLATQQRSVWHSEGDEGSGRRLPRSLQPTEAARSVGVSNPGGICGHRSSVGTELCADRGAEGVKIRTKTLIMTGTENGGRSPCHRRSWPPVQLACASI